MPTGPERTKTATAPLIATTATGRFAAYGSAWRAASGWWRWAPLAPPIVTYVAAAAGLHRAGASVTPAAEAPASVPGAVVAAIVASVVSTAAVYLLACFAWSPERGVTNPLAALGLLVFCGVPALGVAAPSGWLPLAAMAIHLALAPRAKRLWIFVEYGCSALSLLWLLAAFGNVPILPWGLIVAIAQAAWLLRLQPEWPEAETVAS